MVNLPQVGSEWPELGCFGTITSQCLPVLAVSMPTASGNSGDPGDCYLNVNGNLPFYEQLLARRRLDQFADQRQRRHRYHFETNYKSCKISTSTFSAQYGIGGAVFSQITKSGSNRWHGAGYGIFPERSTEGRQL